MNQARIILIRLAEYLGAGLIVAIILALILSVANVALAHTPERIKYRMQHNRFLCYTPDELITQIESLLHSREIWQTGDRMLMAHDLITIYRICEKRRRGD